jgi:hypothetical protein
MLGMAGAPQDDGCEIRGTHLAFRLTGPTRYAPRERIRDPSGPLYEDGSLAFLVDNHSADKKRGNHKPEYNSVDIHSALLMTDHTRLWTD